jgi:hypothetical protein
MDSHRARTTIPTAAGQRAPRFYREAAILLLMAVGCGGSAPSSPQSPSNLPTVTSVTVTAVTTGSQFQCAAVARLSDNSTQTVTTQAIWTSSNSSVATVTASGLVTPISTGSIDIGAAYGGVTGTLRLAVTVSSPSPSPSPTCTLSGTVRDASTGTPLPGAQAEVIDGPDAGKIATTDGSGRYVLAGLGAGQFHVYVRKSGHDTFATAVSLSGDQTLDVALRQTPAAPMPQPTTYLLTGVVRATPLNELLSDARVEAIRDGKAEVSSNTNSSGDYRLPGLAPARYLLRLTKYGYHATDQEVVISGDGHLDLAMDRNRVTIQGFVDEAQPCTGTIQGTRVEVVDGPDAGRFSLNDKTGFLYQITGVAWGTFTLRASKQTYTAVDVTLSVPAPLATESTVTQHFRLPNPTSRFVLSGEVFDATIGRPAGLITGALVEITAGPNTGQATTTGSAGSYRVAALASGVLGLRVSRPGFRTELVSNGQMCGDTQINIPLTPTP